MIEAPLISVIIPVWNGARYIRSTLRALAVQDAPADRFEVLVVDNGSEDTTLEILGDFPSVTVLNEPQPGSYRARNLAVQAAQGKFLLFTDADCRPQPDWVSTALALADEGQVVGVIGGRIELYREGGGSDCAAAFEELTSFNQEGYTAANRCVTANWLCRKDVLQQVGGFNAEMLSGGDFDCARRIAEEGYPINYAPEMLVEHPIRAALSGLIAKRRRVVGGMWTIDGLKDESWLRSMVGLAKNGMRQILVIWRSECRLMQKPGMIAVSVVLTISSLLEATRLRLGAPPYRS